MQVSFSHPQHTGGLSLNGSRNRIVVRNDFTVFKNCGNSPFFHSYTQPLKLEMHITNSQNFALNKFVFISLKGDVASRENVYIKGEQSESFFYSCNNYIGILFIAQDTKEDKDHNYYYLHCQQHVYHIISDRCTSCTKH